MISIWCHGLCSSDGRGKAKGFREKRPEDCRIFQSLKRDFHPGTSNPGVPDRAQRVQISTWTCVSGLRRRPHCLPCSPGPPAQGPSASSLEAPASSVNYQKFPFHLEILLKSLRVLAECRDQENGSGAPPGIPGSSMTCFSPRLRLASGSLRRSDTRLEGPPAASGRRLRSAPGAQQRGLRGAPAFAADTGRTLRPPASLCLNVPPP